VPEVPAPDDPPPASAGVLWAGTTGAGAGAGVGVEGGVVEVEEDAGAWLDAAAWRLTRLCRCGLGAGAVFSDTSCPENEAASAASRVGAVGRRFTVACNFAACAVDPPPLAAREIPKAAANATTATATPHATTLATPTA
jgi:hypothetical protein